VVYSLTPKVIRSQPMEFGIHELKKFVFHIAVTCAEALQELGDFTRI
jgi:hypothetical protein